MVLEWQCMVRQCRSLQYKWSLYKLGYNYHVRTEVHDLQRRISTPINNPTLAFKGKINSNETSLHERTKYILSLRVSRGFDLIDIRNFFFETNSRPRWGRCFVKPREGFALETDFFFECVGWRDEDKPLSYSFKYHTSTGTVVFHRGEASNANATMPLGDSHQNFSLKVEMVVMDSLGASASRLWTIKVGPTKSRKLLKSWTFQQNLKVWPLKRKLSMS